jgi:hypothetical protein
MKPPPVNKRLGRSHYRRFRSRVLVTALFAAFLHFSAAGSHASTITVNSGADAGGVCPGPTCTLRQAIATAISGDTIDFANGLKTIDLTSAELLIGKDLTISGPGADQLTVQRTSTNSNFRIFNIASGHVIMSGLSIAGGSVVSNNTTASGGGILNQANATLDLTECTVSGNSLNGMFGIGNGAGINNAGTLNLDRCTVTSNTILSGQIALGGGLYNTGTVDIRDSIVSGNFGTWGGGIYNFAGTVTVVNSTFSDNQIRGTGGGNNSHGGGAIFNRGILVVSNSDFFRNTVGSYSFLHGGGAGAGIYNYGVATLSNSSIHSHNDGYKDGIVYNNGHWDFADPPPPNAGALDLTNSTISDNVGTGIINTGRIDLNYCTIYKNFDNIGAGGGINNSGTANLRNTLIAGNVDPSGSRDVYGPMTSQGYNLIGVSNGATITPMPGDQIGTRGSSVDPMLGPLQDNGGATPTHLPLSGSPAIDRGGPAPGVTTDQRGKQRPVDDPTVPNAAGGDGSDIGAVELSPIHFNAASYRVKESAGSFALVVTRNGDTSQAATVHYATSDGTATAGSDYNSASGDLTFAPGETEKTITLQIIDDDLYEGDETFSVTLSSPVGGDLGLAVTVITIVAPPARSVNISTRASVQTGDNVMIGGFIITGNVPKPVVLRGLGPSLVAAGVPSDTVLNDPVLELHGASGALILSNDNWKDSPQRGQIEGTAFEPKDDREAVIVATLPPATYTAVLRGSDGGTGVGLMEIYDTDPNSDSTLANISTRALVGTGNDVVIGGFILGGADGSSTIIIRAIGPSLAQFGINDPLADPTLELRDGNGGLMTFDDNWKDDSAQQQQISAAGLAPADDLEAAIAATLPPGTYTAIVAGKDGGTGVGLVEVYNLKN